MFTGILYTHIFYALGGSEMPNGQNLRPIAAERIGWLQADRPGHSAGDATVTLRPGRHPRGTHMPGPVL